MKQFSGVDLRKWIMQNRVSIDTSRITQTYRQDVREVTFALHTKEGKKYLIFLPPTAVILSDKKPMAQNKETGFGRFLRSNVKGSVINSIEQVGSERILKISFSKGFIYVEMFGKGNIVITDMENLTQSTLEKQVLKDRTLTRGELYTLPRTFDTFGADAGQFVAYVKEVIVGNRKQSENNEVSADQDDKINNISRFFAVACGLGGDNAKFVCEKLGLSQQDTLENLFGRGEDIVAAIAALIAEPKDFGAYEEELFATEKKDSQGMHNEKIDKIKKIISQQSAALTQVLEGIDEETKAGEFIYQNYSFFSDAVDAFAYAEEHKKEFTQDVVEKLKQKHGMDTPIKYIRPELEIKLK